MGLLERTDVLILTWNEEANLARTLDALRRFPKVVVLDSGSTDGTLTIASRYPNVRVCSHAFDDHASQWNHGLTSCGLEAQWVLALDADYVLTDALEQEIAALDPAPSVAGYWAQFRYCIDGQQLSGTLYPPVLVLYRREGARSRAKCCMTTERVFRPGWRRKTATQNWNAPCFVRNRGASCTGAIGSGAWSLSRRGWCRFIASRLDAASWTGGTD
jgi:glycosyltransferase involved in cell wall biosynthesis